MGEVLGKNPVLGTRDPGRPPRSASDLDFPVSLAGLGAAGLRRFRRDPPTPSQPPRESRRDPGSKDAGSTPPVSPCRVAPLRLCVSEASPSRAPRTLFGQERSLEFLSPRWRHAPVAETSDLGLNGGERLSVSGCERIGGSGAAVERVESSAGPASPSLERLVPRPVIAGAAG